LHHEARTLIDGAEAAEGELSELFRTPPEASPQAVQDKVLSLLTRAVEASPQNPKPLLRRARWYAAMGVHDKAADDFSGIQAIVPDGHPLKLLDRETTLPRLENFWDFSSPNDVWDVHQCKWLPSESGMTLQPTGDDPFVSGQVGAPAGTLLLTLCVKTPVNLPWSNVFWRTQREPEFSGTDVLQFAIPASEQWQLVRVMIDTRTDLLGLRFDLPDMSQSPVEIAWVSLSRYSREEFQEAVQSKSIDVLAMASDSSVEAQAHFDAGNINKAAELWELELQQFPCDGNAWYRLGLCYMRLAQFPMAIATFEKAAANALSEHGRTEFRNYRAMAMTADQQLDEAIAEFDAILALPPRFRTQDLGYRAEHQRCVAWLLKGDFTKYQRRCRELYEQYQASSDKSEIDTLLSLYALYPTSEEPPDMLVPLAERLYEQHPDDWGAKYTLFTILVLYGNAKSAIERFPEYGASDHSGIRSIYALAQLRLGNPEPAREELKKESLPDISALWYANIMLIQKQLREALRQYDEQSAGLNSETRGVVQD
jgi:tetratricopeptide (TPR) repeat protein